MKTLIILIILIIFLLGSWGCFLGEDIDREIIMDKDESVFCLTSSSFSQGQEIPVEYTCDGKNVNPPLEFSNIPKDTVTLALIVSDPDADNWIHWILWNIEPDNPVILEDDLPEGAVEGINDFNQRGYDGPCPPSGTHHYVFELYALDTELELDPSVEVSGLLDVMEGHILKNTELTGLYSRQ
jgi:Raf kinase inhibitor-like YbhB/YbcL family protein